MSQNQYYINNNNLAPLFHNNCYIQYANLTYFRTRQELCTIPTALTNAFAKSFSLHQFLPKVLLICPVSGVDYGWVQEKCRGALHCQTISNYVFFLPTRMNHSSAPPTGPGPGLCPQFQMVRLALVNEDLDVSTRSLI